MTTKHTNGTKHTKGMCYDENRIQHGNNPHPRPSPILGEGRAYLIKLFFHCGGPGISSVIHTDSELHDKILEKYEPDEPPG